MFTLLFAAICSRSSSMGDLVAETETGGTESVIRTRLKTATTTTNIQANRQWPEAEQVRVANLAENEIESSQIHQTQATNQAVEDRELAVADRAEEVRDQEAGAEVRVVEAVALHCLS